MHHAQIRICTVPYNSQKWIGNIVSPWLWKSFVNQNTAPTKKIRYTRRETLLFSKTQTRTRDPNISNGSPPMTRSSHQRTLIRIFCILLFLCAETLNFTAWGQKVLTRKQPIQALVQAQTIALRTKVLKEGIPISPLPLSEFITQRFRQVGYHVVTDIQSPHDVTVFFQCEEPSPSRPIAGAPDQYVSPLSTPPCFFYYAYQETPIDWQRIDVIVYNEGIQVLESLKQLKPRKQSVAPLSYQYLEALDFPVLFSAEWGQVLRLLSLLKDPQTSPKRQRTTISLLGEIQAEQALPELLNLLEHPTLRVEAAKALGNFGSKAQKPLIAILNTHVEVPMQIAAAQSLGKIGATTGDTSLTPLYLALLEKPALDIQVKTEIVWAIGKSPDFRAHTALEALENQIWTMRSDDLDLQKLREAVDWSIREVRQGGHTGDYE